MLGKVYLTHLHINMQVHRLLAKIEPDAMPGLLHVSAEMLQTVLQIGNARDRAIFMPRDISAVVRDTIHLSTAIRASN